LVAPTAAAAEFTPTWKCGGLIDGVRLAVDLVGPAQNAERRLRRVARVALRVFVLQDHREPVARGLVDVAAVAQDLVEEGAEVALDDEVETVGLVALRPPRVAGDVHEEDEHVHLALGQLGRVRRLLDQLLDPARHELGQARADGFEDLDAAERVGEPPVGVLERRVGTGVLEGDGALVDDQVQQAKVVRRVGGARAFLAKGCACGSSGGRPAERGA
jgi:hypothetical protein